MSKGCVALLTGILHTNLVQIRLLCLITDTNDKRKYLEDDQYWKFTAKGEELMLHVKAFFTDKEVKRGP